MIQINCTPGFFLCLSVAILLLPFPWLTGMILAASAHECGHVFALMAMKQPIKSITAGVWGAQIITGELSGAKERIAAAAGPIAGSFLIMLFPWIPETAICAMIQTLFNLLPIGNSDGARLFRRKKRKIEIA